MEGRWGRQRAAVEEGTALRRRAQSRHGDLTDWASSWKWRSRVCRNQPISENADAGAPSASALRLAHELSRSTCQRREEKTSSTHIQNLSARHTRSR
jgi:hypothetical protein